MEVSVRSLVVLLFLTMTIMLFPMEFQQSSSGIPMESHGFHRESFPEAPGFRPFPLEFLGKKWEFPWKWIPKWLRLQPNAFHRNSMEFRRIPTFHWESSGIRRNSWRRVKTSIPAGLARVLQESSGLCQTLPRSARLGRTGTDFGRIPAKLKVYYGKFQMSCDFIKQLTLHW